MRIIDQSEQGFETLDLSGQKIEIPLGCNDLHHEIELGVIINKTCKRVSKEDAMNFVGGYCLALDMTARDFQVIRNITHTSDDSQGLVE